MLTKWNKLEIEKELYRLDETTVLQLNSAPNPPIRARTHIPPVRLALLAKIVGSFAWKAIALSDFIQPVE
jgi:hypothetical protein